jgi:hypothetical protein
MTWFSQSGQDMLAAFLRVMMPLVPGLVEGALKLTVRHLSQLTAAVGADEVDWQDVRNPERPSSEVRTSVFMGLVIVQYGLN